MIGYDVSLVLDDWFGFLVLLYIHFSFSFFWAGSGVWSPGQQSSPPERDNHQQQQPTSSTSSGNQQPPPIWIPSSQQPSPKSERKEFRPVRLEALKKAQQQPQQVFINSRAGPAHYFLFFYSTHSTKNKIEQIFILKLPEENKETKKRRDKHTHAP